VKPVVDAPARSAAVSPLASVCVSAPAGSGKTELLIQRYLCLLSRVQRPEQVLAITFTRKAAAEMRERVIHALRSALTSEPCATHHQKTTRALAEQALLADTRGGWQLLNHIARFNIKTIDSFCAALTRKMPVLSQFGGQASVQDDVTPLYEEAVQELFKLLDEDHSIAVDLERLLLHFDNNWAQLQSLLVAMLARREQWRSYVGVHHQPVESETYLIATVAGIVGNTLDTMSQLLNPYKVQLLELLQYSATNLGEPIPAEFPGTSPSDVEQWQNIRQLLLNKEGDWRQKVTRTEGFPPGSGTPKQHKALLQKLIAELQLIDAVRSGLLEIEFLPVVAADSASWQLVLHLSRLLPTLAAQLLLVFQKYGVVDHSQVAQSALLALGEDDAPTELALRLDYQIEHILVDEFQDTAITQYELLHKLTRGWGEYNELNPQAPRTLMIVGDGMQSIYGFRGANVGLFLKARREGFNGITLQSLNLHCNFRSDQGVVDWINTTFAQAFPALSDVYRSQVSYRPATATRPPGKEQPVEMHAFQGDSARAQEVEFICKQITGCVAIGRESIAILGRNRSHLQPVIKQLKLLQVPYYAPDLDSLANSPVVTDLLTLCRALFRHTDRLAWMSLLRAPWCGLQLSDLVCIAQFGESPLYTPVWATLQQTALLEALSADGRHRLLHILPVLREALDKRDRLSLRAWVEQAWMGLCGPECTADKESLLDAENFMQLLERAETEGIGFDLDWISQRLQRSYMNPGDPASKVHVLTLHKAKGLEFDRVIIPQLDRLPRGDDREILRWDEHSNARGERSFLLAADDHSAADEPTLYNYLRRQGQQKTLFEATRLLYVGATRAIRHLMLTANVKIEVGTGQPRNPAKRSLLNPIWHAFGEQMVVHDAPVDRDPVDHDPVIRDSARIRKSAQVLKRLVRSNVPAAYSTAKSTATANIPLGAPPSNFVQRSIGIVVHQALEEMSRRPELPTAASTTDQQRWYRALQRESLHGKVLDDALQEVLRSVTQSLREGGAGRWILGAGHREVHSEWSLTTIDATSQLRDIIIDRSFVDATTGIRWIIDYKNSCPESDEPMDSFLDRESDMYSDQLRLYRDAVRVLGNEAMQCGLFFTALGHLQVLSALDLPPVGMTGKP
jgi:ATP-dependent helicase/nuclease subunit A